MVYGTHNELVTGANLNQHCKVHHLSNQPSHSSESCEGDHFHPNSIDNSAANCWEIRVFFVVLVFAVTFASHVLSFFLGMLFFFCILSMKCSFSFYSGLDVMLWVELGSQKRDSLRSYTGRGPSAMGLLSLYTIILLN